MTDSSSFTSLLALVDSHLSKCSVLEGEGSGQSPFSRSIPVPTLASGQTTMSDTKLMTPGQRLPIPTFSASESPITNILAEQLSNMFKAKELKKQQEEEKQRLAEEMKRMKLEAASCLIDLMPAIQRPCDVPKPEPNKISNSSSLESLLFDQREFYKDIDDEDLEPESPPELLPCKTDMSYILNTNMNAGKCSAFGKVLTARLRPVAFPYLREKIESNVVRFDFSTKSPCDLIKEKLKKPTCHNSTHVDLVAQFLAS